MNFDSSPIAAIATAPGRGGIGVVRVSGKNISSIVEAVCATKGAELQPRHATFTNFVNADGSVIDQGLALYFKAPHSYTCLLYTSPSPRDRQKSRMPSSA